MITLSAENKIKKLFFSFWLFVGILALSVPFLSSADFTSAFSKGARIGRVSDANVVGNLSGKFFVNPQGNAVYDIPLSAPPGTAKMAPSLSLHYDSSAPNGMLGMGFSLQGLTAITRAKSNYAQNGVIHGIDFTNADRFALNGQQLVMVEGSTYGADGAQYRTYIDSQSRTISQGVQGNGPATFEVQSKGGQTAWYGTTPDSQILAQGKNTVAVWALSKIQDQAGNYITYHYSAPDPVNGSYYPTEIDYTANDAAGLKAQNSVKFIYEDRPDAITSYTAGSLFKLTQRLKEIQMYQGSTLVSDYKINYEVSPNTFRSRISSIQECDGAGECFRPLQFTWQTNQMGWVETTPKYAPPFPITEHDTDGGQDNREDRGVRFVDVYGNGRPEMLYSIDQWVSGELGTMQNLAWKPTDQGWERDMAFPPPVAIESPIHQEGTTYASRGVDFADLNGDGHAHLLQSLLVVDQSGRRDYIQSHYVAQNNGWQALALSLPAELPITGANLQQGTNVLPTGASLLLDLQGDGRLSLVFGGGVDWAGEPQTLKYSPDGWKPLTNYTSPTPFVSATTNSNYPMGVQVADVNGDGLPDIVAANDQEQIVWLNTGVGWQKATYVPPSRFRFVIDASGTRDDDGGRMLNLTGSGLPDLLKGSNGDLENWINTGAGWIPGPSGYNPPVTLVFGTPGQHTDNGVVFEDVTGSGLPAFLQCSSSSGAGQCRAWLNENGQWVQDQDYAPQSEITDAKGHDNGLRFVDLLGTGFPDMVWNNGEGPGRAWLNKAQTKPDVITNVQDALGDNLNIQYKPITDNSIYTKGSSATYPNMDVQAPIYVVSQTASDTDVTPITIPAIAKKIAKLVNSNAVQHITSYHYANALFNHLGWGFLGFGAVTTTDQFTGLTVTTNYSQDSNAHTQGMPTGTVTTKSDGTVINKQVSTLSTNNNQNGTYFPYVSQTVETAYDFNTGNLMGTKTTQTQIDDEGNPTDILETDVDSSGTYSLHTQNTYENLMSPFSGDHPQWFIGQLMQTVVTNTSTPAIGSPSTITRTSSFTYDPNSGFLTSSTAEPGSTTNQLTKTYTRDVFGNIIQTDITGSGIASRNEKIGYDATGTFIVSKTNALGETTHYQTDPRFGAVTQTTDANGLSESNTLDGFGRVISTTHPDGSVSNIQYDWASGDPSAPAASVTKITMTQAGTPTKISYHDELDREIAQAMQGFAGSGQSRWIWQLTNYDELGRVVGKSLPFYAGETVYEGSNQFDALGRIVLTINPDDTAANPDRVNQTYNGYSTVTTNPKGQATTRVTNIRGNLLQTTDPQGHLTNYQYDAFNNLTQLTDSKGHISTMQYDNLGHKIAMNDVDRGKSTYSYDALGELLSQTDAKNQTTTYQYDLTGRMTARTDPSGAVSTWAYGSDPTQHNVGKLTAENGASSLKSGNVSVQKLYAIEDNLVDYNRTYNYDNLGRLISNTVSMQGINYTTGTTYDQNSRPDTITYPNNVSIKNHYDPFGYLMQVTDNKSGITYSNINTMDASSHVLSVTHSNGLVTNYIYNPANNFLTDIQTNQGQSLQLEQQFLPGVNAGRAVGASLQSGVRDWHLNIAGKHTLDPNVDQTGVSKINALFKSPSVNTKITSPLEGEVSRSAGEEDASPIQSLHYTYDVLGNVSNRQDAALNVQDNYSYDTLNRITQDQTVDNAHGGQITALTYGYDELGNITDKSDVGHYTYGENTAGPHAVTSISGSGVAQEKSAGQPIFTRFRAPARANAMDGMSENDNFSYDANGDQTQATMHKPDGSTITRNISYTSFDVPKEIVQNMSSSLREAGIHESRDGKHKVTSNVVKKADSSGGLDTSTATVDFFYDANHKRFMREDTVIAPDGSTTKNTTLYLDGLEIDTTQAPNQTPQTVWRNYIGDTELVTDEQSNASRYDILKDNIGSTSLITDSTGNVVQRFHYDPFGEQQLVAGMSSGSVILSGAKDLKRQKQAGSITSQHSNENLTDRTSITRYGFTGQEEVAAGGIDLIHMNGRMYDPHLGRFLSADPTIQDPSNSQSLNRYSYCLNDPLALTDPSGFSWLSHLGHFFDDLFKGLGHGLQAIFRNSFVDAILEIIVSAVLIEFGGPMLGMTLFEELASAAAFDGVVGYAQSGSIGVGLQTAAIAFASEYAWAGTGTALDEDKDGWETRSLVHGVEGGAMSKIEGGSFKNGFLSAAVSQAMSGSIDNIQMTSQSWATSMSRGLAAGVVGGTVAAATGGNFENGMMTSAFAEIFNDELHSLQKGTAVLVNRSVDAPGLDDIKNHPSWMHTAIRFDDGDIWGYYDDGRVRLDPQHAGDYQVMSDEQTEEMFGTKNSFENDKMQAAFDKQRNIWDDILNPNALEYYPKSFPPFVHQHNCNDFVGAVIQTYKTE